MQRERYLPQLSALFSAGLTVSLGVAAFKTQSQLGFAQAADSLLDVGAAVLLAWSAQVAREPRDESHHLGHTRAEALGALAVSALAFLLGFEVVQGAALALLDKARPDTGHLVPLVILKVVIKVGIFVAARPSKGPALRALAVDARNDILVGTLSLLGLGAAELGHPGIDPWLALPLGLYIVRSGVVLAAENTALLMGQAPSPRRQEELRAFVREILPDPARALDLRAQHLGPELALEIEIEVPGRWSALDATSLADRVRNRLESEDDVMHAAVVLRARRDDSEPGLGGPL